jgi:hypothetical protein
MELPALGVGHKSESAIAPEGEGAPVLPAGLPLPEIVALMEGLADADPLDALAPRPSPPFAYVRN